MMNIFTNGLMTGLILQLAIGPVFFFIVNLAIQRSLFDGLVAALAVTIVDYFYITLSILGVGKLMEHKSFKRIFGVVSSVVLIVFGTLLILNSASSGDISALDTRSNLTSSFFSVLLLTLSSPMTIVFFTSLFTAKAVEHEYVDRQLWLFGLGVGFATLLFMTSSVLVFAIIGSVISNALISILNILVGALLIGYGLIRGVKILKVRPSS